ncbi:unnamed protein product [Nippostrongylus brasiliensis]|uniref:Uncharacterized protein n=1 Tax=Nippostrongylus brasiliensis TaxID=27835 RepID=A0A0N4XCD0_NIPBR|nr:unnamed protein product [Nippostrongylus brasiliensis]
MLLDSARFDNIPSADRRLLYATTLPFSDEEEDERYDTGDDRQSRTSSRAPSELSLQRLSRYPRKSRGLFVLRQPSLSNRGGVIRRPSSSDHSNRSHAHSVSSQSDQSASLRIVFEGQQDCWDDEFATTEPHYRQSIISRAPQSPMKVVQSASVGDMSTVFDEVMSMTSAVDQPDLDALYDPSTESDDPNHEEVIQRCLTDSKYMYESVIVASLWDLAQEKPSTSQLRVEPNEMTDSGFSRSTRSKNGQEPRSLFDSAIGGDLFSSEDESVDKVERHVLNPLRESDTTSQASLEWCDDGLRGADDDTTDGGIRFAAGGFDPEYDSNRGSAAGSSKSSLPFSVCPLHRPKDSRDLMVYACEKFPPYSSQFKGIQNLYHRRRLRRIAPSPRTADETLRSFLSSALYHGYDLLKRSPAALLKQELAMCNAEISLRSNASMDEDIN